MYGTLSLSILAVLLAVFTVAAGDKPGMTAHDCEQLWSAQQQEQAFECLNALLTADPANPRLHFLKGEYCLARGNVSCAQEEFGIKSVRSAFALEIADLYKKEADFFYHEAVVLNPAVRIETVKKTFQEDKRALGLFHLAEAKKWAVRAGFEIVADEHRRFAGKYLGDAEVEKELPEVIMLSPRKQAYEFQLKKGEQTGSWIAWNGKTTTHLHFFEVNNDKYEVRYKNGERVRVWAGERMPKIPDDQFRIVGIEDTTVLIVVD